jgi:CDP-2,3-bis-(O-geranylgeranyl)-sn-glycerol synthase
LECYIISIESFIIPLLSAVWIMLPAYVPNPTAALFGGGIPIDFGKSFPDRRRILGDGKTYRGLFFGVLAGVGIGLLQIQLSDTYGLVSLRRLGKERGEKWPIADQYDLVAGAFMLMLLFDPSWILTYVTFPVLIIILILTPILHRVVNMFGYLMGVKEVPW